MHQYRGRPLTGQEARPCKATRRSALHLCNENDVEDRTCCLLTMWIPRMICLFSLPLTELLVVRYNPASVSYGLAWSTIAAQHVIIRQMVKARDKNSLRRRSMFATKHLRAQRLRIGESAPRVAFCNPDSKIPLGCTLIARKCQYRTMLHLMKTTAEIV